MIAHLTPYPVVLAHYQARDPQLAQVITTLNLADWLEDVPDTDHFINLTRNIIYQQLAGQAASTIYGRFKARVGGLTPPHVLAVPDQDLRDVGLSWAKVRYVKDLALKVKSGELNLKQLDAQSNEAIITELTQVKGIGRWTAEMFLLFTLHRENIFSYGDLGLKNGFTKLYHQAATPQNMTPRVALWDPYQSYACLALWHFLDNR